MIQKCSIRATLICIIVCFVLLLAFLSGSTVQAGGNGDQWPTDPPDPTSSTEKGGGTDGIEAMIAFANLMQVIL
jgi:hypothetical protein